MTNVIFESHLYNIYLESNLIFRPVIVVPRRLKAFTVKKSTFKSVFFKRWIAFFTG